MTIAARLQEHLATHRVAYDVVEHPRAYSASRTAQASHVSGNRLAKAVMLKAGERYLLAVLPASHHIDFRLLENLLADRYTLASEEEASRFFQDCETGALPAVGTAYGLDVVMDDSLAGQPEVYIEAGDHAHLLHLSGEQFASLMGGAHHGRFSAHD